jgi:hypothetical protein
MEFTISSETSVDFQWTEDRIIVYSYVMIRWRNAEYSEVLRRWMLILWSSGLWNRVVGYVVRLQSRRYRRNLPLNYWSPSLTKQKFFSYDFPENILPQLDHPLFTSLCFTTIYFILQSKVFSLTCNHQPGGPGLCIYVPQWQGGPVIPPGTGFPSRHLLPLSGLMWGCQTILWRIQKTV